MPKKTEAPQETVAESTAEKRDYSLRRWMPPNKRAKGYAEERKAKVHQRGPKEGQELSEYDKGLRSGYLLAQSDSAGLYKYKKAIDEGKSVQEAREISLPRTERQKLPITRGSNSSNRQKGSSSEFAWRFTRAARLTARTVTV